MTHTPGPWSADYGDFAAYCETGAEVCEVTRGRHDDGSRIPDDEMEANLNLVAAAPDLLAALTNCRDWLVAICDSNKLEPTERGYLEAATLAIAKAEGRGE